MFEYRLEAPGVQPALSRFVFIVSSSGLTPWQPLPNVTPTGVSSGSGKGLVPLNNISGRTDIVIAISVIASVLMIIVTAILFVKCRMGKEELHNKRSNGHLCQMNDARHRKNSHFDDIYDSCARSAIMSLGSDQQIASPRLNAQERYTGNGTLPRHHAPYGTISGGHTSVGANLSDSDSWMESSRSRETSPSSSIPPSLPAFRVIPLCESESSGTHLSDPPPILPPMFSRNSKDVSDDHAVSGSGQPPLLRKNQYWV